MLNVRISSDKRQALLSVRLLIEFPTGAITLISRGMLNSTHQDSHENLQELEPGKFYDVSINLDVLGQKNCDSPQVVALSPTDWPQAWPSAEASNLTIDLEHTNLRSPLLEPTEHFDIKFEAPEIVQPIDREIIRKESRTREVIFDVINNEWTIEDFSDEGKRRLLSTVNGIEWVASIVIDG